MGDCRFPNTHEQTYDIFGEDDVDLCSVHNSYRSAGNPDVCLYRFQHGGFDLQQAADDFLKEHENE